MKNYIFDLQKHLQQLKTDGQKEDFVNRYEAFVQPLTGIREFSDFPFYEPFLAKMITVPYVIPEEFADHYDWELLFRLICATRATAVVFEWNRDKALPELQISIPSETEEIPKAKRVDKVSELMSFQVLRLFEIYTEELMNNELLCMEDPIGDNGLGERNERMLKKNRELVLQIKKTQLIENLLI
ncbi:MAG: hypothetical protein NTW16_04115 [Bacteroidetes bacterium]|nr:hypothetical protein [Bacteroidota bacterium]